jgi:hypothetical protein
VVRFHLHRALCTALGNDKETRGKVWQAIKEGDIETGLRLIGQALKKARGEQAKRIAGVYHYLVENSSGLGDYRTRLRKKGKVLRRTGAIEGNIDKLIVRRMKNQGMSWTLKGIHRLLCVRFLALEGKLSDWLFSSARRGASQKGVTLPRKKMRSAINRISLPDPGDWLQVQLPALSGPHASRPWVTALRELSEVSLR